MTNGAVIWFTGLPSAGKSKLARAVFEELRKSGRAACILDSDAMRRMLAPSHAYSDADRGSFYELLARLAAELAEQGLVVLVSATAHRRAFRERARALARTFLEVFVNASLEECRARDSKGLYRANAEGRAPDFPGAPGRYEAPERPDVVASGGRDQEAVAELVRRVAELGDGS